MEFHGLGGMKTGIRGVPGTTKTIRMNGINYLFMLSNYFFTNYFFCKVKINKKTILQIGLQPFLMHTHTELSGLEIV